MPSTSTNLLARKNAAALSVYRARDKSQAKSMNLSDSLKLSGCLLTLNSCHTNYPHCGALMHNWRGMTVAQIDIPTAQFADLCRRNGIRKLTLFGSVVTDRFTDSSDIDVLVDFRPQERVGFFRLADIEEALRTLLGGRKIDLRAPMDLSRYFRDQVVRDALVIYAES